MQYSERSGTTTAASSAPRNKIKKMMTSPKIKVVEDFQICRILILAGDICLALLW